MSKPRTLFKRGDQKMKPPFDWDRFVRLWQAGIPSKQMAAELGISPRTVTVYASRLRVRGIPLHSRRGAALTPEKVATLQKIAAAPGVEE